MKPEYHKSGRDAKKIAVLFLSHVINDKILEEYRKISRAIENKAKSHFLIHARQLDMPVNRKSDDNIYQFSNESLNILQYPSTEYSFWRTNSFKNIKQYFPIAKSFFPYNVHFPLLYFYLQNNNYDYYWLIEYDVRFSGDWRFFFESFQDIEADLLTCRMWNYFDKPSWYWWRCIWHPKHFISLENRLSSFNPIYRISNPALRHLHQSHLDGWVGHYEVLVPTLLYGNGFKLVGIGGAERFVCPGQRNTFYTSKTFRWRPVFKTIGVEINKLYHPIKS
jgi:hypothetical protein